LWEDELISTANQHLKPLLVGDFTLRRFVRSTVLVILLCVLGLFLYAYMFADSIIFQPPPVTYNDTRQILKLSTVGGEQVSAIFLPNERSAFTILYSHGNAEDLGTVRYKLEALRQMGYSVLGYDYEGYGTSQGKPSEGAAYRDIDAAYEYLTGEQRVPADRVIAYGWSLGGAVAADLAARKPLAGLILESTFVSAYRVMTRAPVLPFDKFRTLAKLERVRCPILVMHGEQDEVVGFWHGQKLYERANEPKRRLWVRGAGHGELEAVAGERYRRALEEFAELLAKR
jgi:fermentation-respiration switch protein FrsA (DUF1100 family)